MDRAALHARPAGDGAAARSILPRVGPGAALGAGVAAGLVAWAGGEVVDRLMTTPLTSEFLVSGGQQFAQRAEAITRKAALSYGLLGAALGLALGGVGGLARRSGRGAMLGAGLGLVLGAAVGGGTALVAVPWFLSNERPMEDDLILPLLTHGAIWLSLGAAAGLAMGVGLKGEPVVIGRAALGGLLGAFVATAVYELAGALLFPLEQTSQPLSEGAPSRLFGRLVVAIAVALGAALAAKHAVPPRDVATEPR